MSVFDNKWWSEKLESHTRTHIGSNQERKIGRKYQVVKSITAITLEYSGHLIRWQRYEMLILFMHERKIKERRIIGRRRT